MAYRFEQTPTGTDIVIDGWEVGVSNSPYQTIVPTNMVSNGVSDMRNVDIISVPGEASVGFATQAMTSNLALSNVTFTVNPLTGVFTWAGGTALPSNTAITVSNSGGALPGNLSSSTAYYILNPTATTFQLSTPGASTVQVLTVAGGGGSGQNSFSRPGAGGGGGVDFRNHSISVKSYAVAVGFGGSASTGTGTGGTGGSSTFDTVTINGGGGGGDDGNNNGVAGANATGGGSGGGGGGGTISSGAGGTATGAGHAGASASSGGGGGGGGAGTAGSGGTGGTGVSNSISGTSMTYGVGGGFSASSAPGTANTGNGAQSGASGSSNPGGSGTVIISYPTGSLTATGGTMTISGGMTIHTFGTPGSTTWVVTAINYVGVTTAGTGTNSFSVINMVQPQYIKGVNLSNLVTYYFCQDSNGRVWILDNQYLSNSGLWLYTSNLANETVLEFSAGMIPWKGYLLSFDSNNLNYISLQTSGTPNALVYFLTYANWVRAWKVVCPYSLVTHYPLASSNNSANLFFCNAFTGSSGLYSPSIGNLVQLAGKVFDPTDSSTYSLGDGTLPLPLDDVPTCLEELGGNLLIGGAKNIIYQWDEFSLLYNDIIRLSENYTHRMVTVNSTTYIFCGQRGRIYLTNGANAQLYDKIPDHLSNTVNPYYTWGDATFSKNQLYFGVSATDNSGNAIPNYGGLWAIDTDTNAKRIVNQLSYGTYAGLPTAICPLVSLSSATANLPTSDGNGLYTGWFSGTIGGIDRGLPTPYTGGQAYVDSDIIPVGNYLTKRTFQNVEFKLSTPLVAGESVSLNYRTNITEGYTNVPLTAGGGTGDLSGYGIVDFQNVQWVQIRPYLTSTATNPSYCRLKEIRIR